jgi:hypothetical protein
MKCKNGQIDTAGTPVQKSNHNCGNDLEGGGRRRNSSSSRAVVAVIEEEEEEVVAVAVIKLIYLCA